jgi:hypothetical protein
MHVRILRVVFTWAVFTSLSWWNVSVNSAIEENGQGTEAEPETSGPLSLGVSDKSERVMLRSASATPALKIAYCEFLIEDSLECHVFLGQTEG